MRCRIPVCVGVMTLLVVVLAPGGVIGSEKGLDENRKLIEEASALIEEASQRWFERRMTLLEKYSEAITEQVEREVAEGVDRREALDRAAGVGRAERVAKAKQFLLEQIHSGALDLDQIVGRFGLYRATFERHFEPDSVYLAIPFQESRYVRYAFNEASVGGQRETVKGLWQFTESTGRQYRLSVTDRGADARTRDADERYDPRKSTAAARAFLSDLEERLGEDGGSDLVIAAYHVGPGNVEGLISRYGNRDFWSWREDPKHSFGSKSYHYPALVLAAHELLSEKGVLE